MTTFYDLPRDVIKRILSKMDIDTRVKVGIIFKLKVPTRVVTQLSRCLQVPETYDELHWSIKLGPYIWEDSTWQRYHLTRYYTCNGSIVYLTHAILGTGTMNYSDLHSYDQSYKNGYWLPSS